MRAEIRTIILEHYSNISSKQKQVADYILEHADAVSTMTMKELAHACDVAEPTIVRFFNKLGYESFLAFRVDLAKEINIQPTGNLGDGYTGISATDTTSDIISKTADAISICMKMTESTLDAGRIDAVTQLMQQAKSIVFYGAGNSSSIAMDAHYRFFRMGLDAFCSENLHLTLTKISHMSDSDLVILISHSGESMDMLACARAAKEKGLKVVGITGNFNSPLSKLADYILFTNSRDLEVYSDAMVSRMAQMMILDILYIKLRLNLGQAANSNIKDARSVIVNFKTASN